MQQFGVRLNQPYSGVPIIRADCRFQCLRQRVGGYPLLQFGPVGESILAPDDELSVAETKGPAARTESSPFASLGCRRRIRSNASRSPFRHWLRSSRASRFGTSR
jgi:hypothetical protein